MPKGARAPLTVSVICELRRRDNIAEAVLNSMGKGKGGLPTLLAIRAPADSTISHGCRCRVLPLKVFKSEPAATQYTSPCANPPRYMALISPLMSLGCSMLPLLWSWCATTSSAVTGGQSTLCPPLAASSDWRRSWGTSTCEKYKSAL